MLPPTLDTMDNGHYVESLRLSTPRVFTAGFGALTSGTMLKVKAHQCTTTRMDPL